MQKINSLKLDSFRIVIVFFYIKDKKQIFYFFEEIFLLTRISINETLEILFLILSNIKIDFASYYFY